MGGCKTHSGSISSAPNIMNSTPILTCTQCSGENALASRFCQHCGAPLQAAGTAAEATNAAAAALIDAGLPPVGATVPAIGGGLPPVAAADTAATSPVAQTPAANVVPLEAEVAAPSQADIDQRRAHQLLDRALMLSEKGDLAGALLACRQAVSLTPASAQGYSMWGLLLERAGETGKAIAAYEKVLQLAPDSVLERESLQRLRAVATKNSLTGTFNFDEGELFNGVGATAAAAAAPRASVPPTGTSTATPASVDPNAPVAPVTPGPSYARPPAMRFDDPNDTPGGGPMWLQALLRQPSYYFRGAPLMAVTLIGLVFLLWARDFAADRQAPVTPSANPGSTEIVTDGTPVPGSDVNQTPNTTKGLPEGPVAVTNATPVAPAPAPAAGGGAPAGGGRVSDRAPAAGGGDPLPPPVRSTVRPADPGGLTPTRPSGSNSLPAPRIDRNDSPNDIVVVTPAPPASAPETSPPAGGSTSGPLDTGPKPNSGFIRITPGTSNRAVPRSVSPASAPARPDNIAENEERIASAEARAGRTDRAVERLASAGGNDADGYRYQQRGNLFLERGDHARAADEYQTAVNAYEKQIAQGDNVAQARAGLRSARSGLRLALSGLRR